MSRASAQPRSEQGTVLVLFALLLVGVFGLLGVVVDGSRLRVTSQRLEAGAECAALEGVRWKDIEGDVRRRERARTALSWQFDDDLDADNGDAIGLGAGTLPVVENDTSLGGDVLVSTLPAARVFKPAAQLQANLGNEVHGDLVAGTHVVSEQSFEDDTFGRSDFAPTAAGSTVAQLAAADSLLVRLRRATERLALDRQPDESSAGPAFEWLWARGGAWQEPGVGEDAQSRADGLTVRSAAIATATPALAISDDPNDGVSLATIALRGDAGSTWNATTPGAAMTLDIDATGTLSLTGVEQGVTLLNAPRVVGAPLLLATAGPSVLPATELVIAAYATLDGARTTIAFTRALATISGNSITITRLPAAVSATSASSISPAALDARVAFELDPTLRDLHNAVAEPVLAPSLRR